MASGIPWLSYNVGNLKDHKGGIIVDNFSQLTEELNRLKNNPNLLLTLANEGYNHAVTYHNWDQIVLIYQDLYFS
jgi:glycosyltransferase involved in cell wall biosynthesis